MDNKYEAFNNFQTAFYTNISVFEGLTNIEFKNNGYMLLNNLAKGYPHLAGLFFNVKGFGWSGPESPSILKALQKKFVNNFNSVRVPKFIYFKQNKPEKEKTKAKKTKNGLIFDSEINAQICSILMIDSKTLEYLKFSDRVQFLGNQLIGEFIQKEKTKTTRKKKPII
jgi:phosphoribosylformylglycinamidine (FGAM) synthase PurS component